MGMTRFHAVTDPAAASTLASEYDTANYRVVQIGPTDSVELSEGEGEPDYWPKSGTGPLYLVIATKD